MTRTDRSGVLRLAQARTRIPGPAGEHAATGLHRGTLDVALSLPVRPDAFEAGDLLFVAAGTEHQFEDFGDDLAVWRVFYGPPGGEMA
jgi:hypothetical protein